jgi:RimJ/RimL family protein N-acetyltransferase
MQQLEREQFALAQPLFAELAAFNLSVEAVLAGTAPGEVYVDDLKNPCVAFAITPEGHYLAGDAEQEHTFPALKELVPPRAYLTFSPDRWEAKVRQIWVNQAARKHSRQHLHWVSQRIPNWRELIPDGFRVVRIDRALLAQRELKNHDVVVERVGSWHSQEYFLQHGFGFCVLKGDTIASSCIADCVVGDKCEIGIATDSHYRRRGLATLAVAATVETCVANGFNHIGWHCLQSNVGSIAVAEKVGFAKTRDYFAYSSILPTENVADMTVAEYEEWAVHYERFIPENFVYGYDAARAWSLAGNQARALVHLRQIFDLGWRGRPEWLARYWVFASLRGIPEFEAMIALLRQEADNESGS